MTHRENVIFLVGLTVALFLAFTGCTAQDVNLEPEGNENEYGIVPEVSAGDDGSAQDHDAEDMKWDRIPMVMVNGKLYYDTGNESTIDGRCGVMDGEITTAVDGSEIPTQDNQSNFGTGFGYQFGPDDTIEVFMNEKWIVFAHRDGTGSQVRFGDKMIDADGLSQETLEWLDWYNSLSEEEQLSVSALPADLLEELDLVETEDAAVSGDS